MDSYQETFDTWNSVAALYDQKFGNLSIYDDGLDFFGEQIAQPNPQLLDMACGPGNITKFLANIFPNATIDAFDIAPNMIDIARSNAPSASFEILDIRNISQISKTYNGITCGFCAPYLSKDDLQNLFQSSYKLLEENGTFYISFIGVKSDYSEMKIPSIGGRMLVHYYQIEGFQNHLIANNFEILKTIQVDFDRLDHIEKHIAIIAKKIAR